MRKSGTLAICIGATLLSAMFVGGTTVVAQVDLSSVDLTAFGGRTFDLPPVITAIANDPATGSGVVLGYLGPSGPADLRDLGMAADFMAGQRSLILPIGLELESGMTVILDPEWAYDLIDRMESETWE